LVGAWVLGEPASFVAVASAISGAILVARPAALFSSANASRETTNPAGYVAAVVESFCSAGVTVSLRLIGRRGGDDFAALAHANALFGIVASPVAMIGLSGPPVVRASSMRSTTLLAVAGAGAAGVANQLLLAFGLQRAPAALGAVLRTLEVAFGFFWQSALFGGKPAATSLAGAALIVGASLLAAAHTASSSTSSSQEERPQRRRRRRGLGRLDRAKEYELASVVEDVASLSRDGDDDGESTTTSTRIIADPTV